MDYCSWFMDWICLGVESFFWVEVKWGLGENSMFAIMAMLWDLCIVSCTLEEDLSVTLSGKYFARSVDLKGGMGLIGWFGNVKHFQYWFLYGETVVYCLRNIFRHIYSYALYIFATFNIMQWNCISLANAESACLEYIGTEQIDCNIL